MVNRIKTIGVFIFKNWHIKGLSLLAAIGIVIFNDITNLEQRVITVPLDAQLPTGYLPVEELPKSVRVSLRGEGDQIVTILSDDIYAYVDLSKQESAGPVTASIKLERRGTALEIDPLETVVDPTQINIRLDERIEQTFDVALQTTGVPPRGYEIARIRSTPASLTIAGPVSAIEELDVARTENLNMSNKTESFSTTLQIVRAHEYIQYPEGNTIRVQVEIVEVPITQTLDLSQVEIINLRSGFNASYNTVRARIVIEGLQSRLTALSSDDIVLTADAATVNEPGVFTLIVAPRIPDDFADLSILDFQPTEIEVDINI